VREYLLKTEDRLQLCGVNWSRITVPVSERGICYCESEAEFITGFGAVCTT